MAMSETWKLKPTSMYPRLYQSPLFQAPHQVISIPTSTAQYEQDELINQTRHLPDE